jgi:hypothetical protein
MMIWDLALGVSCFFSAIAKQMYVALGWMEDIKISLGLACVACMTSLVYSRATLALHRISGKSIKEDAVFSRGVFTVSRQRLLTRSRGENGGSR